MGESINKVRRNGYTAHSNGSDTAKGLGYSNTYPWSRSGTIYDRINSASGVKNPFWKDTIRNGGNATTPFTGTEFSASITPFQYDYNSVFHPINWPYPPHEERYGYGYGTCAEYGTPNLNDTPPDGDTIADATNRCIQDFMRSCQSARSSIMGGQSLGEYREVLHTMTRPMASLRRHVLSYTSSVKKRTKGMRRVNDVVKAVSDSYLEWTFGWDPLVSDIAAAYVDWERFRYPVIPVSGSATNTYAGSSGTFSYAPSAGSPVALSCRVSSSMKYYVRMKGAIKSGSDASGKISSAQAYRLLPRDWVPTLYELIPYSFVIDYFTTLGTVIESACFVFGDLSWGCKTVKTLAVTEYGEFGIVSPTAVQPPSHSVLFNSSCSGGNAIFLDKRVERSVLHSEDLMARFQVKIPELAEKPWRNMAALVGADAHDWSKYIKKLIPK